MFKENDIKTAFIKEFKGTGERWFPLGGPDADKAVEEAYESFFEKLWMKHPSRNPVAASTPTQSNPTTRVLVVGMRRFTRPDSPAQPWQGPWDWASMLRCPGLSADKTPTAWNRLHDAGLIVDTAIDLLPPGGEVDEVAAARSAQYLRGVLAGLEAGSCGFDVVVMLGGKVASAFKTADERLRGLHLLELRHGFVTFPSPHVVERDGDGWWSSEEKQDQLRDVVEMLMADCRGGEVE